MAKLLVVDDSQLSRRLLKSILTGAGHEVLEEEDGLSAIERYAADSPDAVFLDMTMKGMHGLEVLAKIRELDPTAKVIIGTADIQASTRTLTTEGGAKAFLEKPFSPEKVLAVLEKVLHP
jgi:two-component system chemotaxis response regulator CheY